MMSATLKALLNTRDEHTDFRSLTESEKKQFSAELKRLGTSGRYTYGAQVERLLINFGDAETLNEVLSHFQSNDWDQRSASELLGRCKQPLLVSLVAPELAIKEGTKGEVSGGDLELLPKSVMAANVMITMLKNCPEFPEEVKAWANGVTMWQRESLRAAMRDFWQEN